MNENNKSLRRPGFYLLENAKGVYLTYADKPFPASELYAKARGPFMSQALAIEIAERFGKKV